MQEFDGGSRQTIEAGNKEEKTTFKVQHLMSRSAAGIRIQALLTVFAANFVRFMGRDAMRRRKDPAASSFWVERGEPRSPANYFKLY